MCGTRDKSTRPHSREEKVLLPDAVPLDAVPLDAVPPDVLLLDVFMGGIGTGWECLEGKPPGRAMRGAPRAGGLMTRGITSCDV
jgi:hypothetical protein